MKILRFKSKSQLQCFGVNQMNKRAFPLFIAIFASMVIVIPRAVQADPFGGLFSHKSGDKDASKSDTPALPPYSGPKKRVAVMPLDDKVSASTAATTVQGGQPGIPGTTSTTTIQPPSDFGTGLTEMLTTELSKTNRYVLLERQNLTDVTGEQSQDAAPGFDQASAPKAGSLLGAQILIRGAVTEYSYSTSGSSTNAGIGNGGAVSSAVGSAIGGTLGGLIGGSTAGTSSSGIGGGYSHCTAKLTIDLRIIDASSGEIIDSVDADGSASSSSFNLSADVQNAQFGTSTFNQTPLGKAVRQAIDGAVYQICADQNLNAIPWEAQVADMDSAGTSVSTLYLDAGSDAGVKAGDVLTVLKPGRTIISPETRTVIGRTKDSVIGHCHVDSVTNNLATASVVDGAGFAVGQCVRYPNDVTALAAASTSTPSQ
jgi:curli biogenesis system outer membrane secretion channel CsgG